MKLLQQSPNSAPVSDDTNPEVRAAELFLRYHNLTCEAIRVGNRLWERLGGVRGRIHSHELKHFKILTALKNNRTILLKCPTKRESTVRLHSPVIQLVEMSVCQLLTSIRLQNSWFSYIMEVAGATALRCPKRVKRNVSTSLLSEGSAPAMSLTGCTLLPEAQSWVNGFSV